MDSKIYAHVVTDELIDHVYKSLNLKTGMSKEMCLVMLENLKVFDQKQQDYSSNNISAFGEKGVLVRCNDKMERLKNLVWLDSSKTPNHEAVDDTWLDLANYSYIGYLCRNNLWK